MTHFLENLKFLHNLIITSFNIFMFLFEIQINIKKTLLNLLKLFSKLINLNSNYHKYY